jgi:hypothetical protein
MYANTTTTPNCTNDLFFKINIKPIPLVDQLNAVLRCEMTLTFYQSSLMESTLLDQIELETNSMKLK